MNLRINVHCTLNISSIHPDLLTASDNTKHIYYLLTAQLSYFFRLIMARPVTTRSTDDVWLIGHPCETMTGARLPSGRDVMQNFVYYHKSQKHTLSDSP